MNRKQTGIKWAVIAAVISAVAIFYNKLVVTKGVDALTYNILKNGGAAVILFFILLARSKFFRFRKEIRKNYRAMLILGFLGGSLPFLLFFQGLQNTSAVNANTIHKTLFIWVAIISVIFLKEKISKFQILGYLLVMVFSFFLVSFQNLQIGAGEILIFLATFFWSAENIIARKFLKNTDHAFLAFSRMFIGVVLLVLFSAVINKELNLGQFSLFVYLKILTSSIILSGYVYSWYKALKNLPATAVTSILVLSSPMTNIFTIILERKTVPVTDLSLVALMIFGVFLIIRVFINYETAKTKT